MKEVKQATHWILLYVFLYSFKYLYHVASHRTFLPVDHSDLNMQKIHNSVNSILSFFKFQ